MKVAFRDLNFDSCFDGRFAVLQNIFHRFCIRNHSIIFWTFSKTDFSIYQNNKMETEKLFFSNQFPFFGCANYKILFLDGV